MIRRAWKSRWGPRSIPSAREQQYLVPRAGLGCQGWDSDLGLPCSELGWCCPGECAGAEAALRPSLHRALCKWCLVLVTDHSPPLPQLLWVPAETVLGIQAHTLCPAAPPPLQSRVGVTLSFCFFSVRP